MYYVSCLEFIEENIIDHGMYDNIEELLKSSFCQEVINCREGIYLSEKQKEDNFNKVNNDMYPKGGCRICSSEITAVPNPYNNGWNYIDLLLGFVDGDYYSDLMIAHDIKTNKWLTIATDNRKTTEDCFTCLSWSDTIDDAISDL